MAFGRVTALQADVVFSAQTGEAKIEMQRLLTAAEDTYGGISDASLRAAVAQERYTRTLATTSEGSYAAGRATVAYRRELDAITADADRAAAAQARVAAAQRKTQLTAATSAARTLTTFVGVPAALIAGVAGELAIKFNQQMLLIQTQAGASAAEVKKLSAAVLELAKVAPQSPEELAKGLYHLESLGLRGANAMDTLKISSIAAGMGISDLETVTTALGGAVVTGIKGAQNYQEAMNTLIATVGAGNVRMEDLAGAIGNVAPAAAAAGVSLPELGAAFATLTDRGMSAEEAATRLRMTFALLQNQSPKAKKALADLGVNANSLAVTLRKPGGLSTVLHELHDGIESVGKTRGNRDLLQAFGGGRSGLGIQTLVGSLDSQLSSYDDKVKQVAADEKKAADARAAYLASPAYKLHAALSSVQADLIKLGESLTPVFVDAGKAISGVADAIEKLPHAAKVELGIIVGLLAVGGPLGLAVLGTIKLVDGIGAAFARLPGRTAPAIAATDAELATLRATAAETGTAAGASLAGGVAAGTAEAEASIGLLEASLLGLGALAIAPIVIPIVYHVFKNGFGDAGGQIHPFGGNPAPGPVSRPGSIVQYPDGKFFKIGSKKSGYNPTPYTPKVGDTYYKSTDDAAHPLTFGPKPPTGYQPGSYGKAPSTKANPGGYLPIVTTPTVPTTTSTSSSTGTPLGGLAKIQLAVSNAQLATARGARGAKQQLIAALDEEVAYDRRWEAKQEDLLRRHVGDTKQHAKILQGLQQDEASALDQIAGINHDAATKAKQAADKAAADRKKAAAAIKQARDARVQSLTAIPIDLRIEETKAEARGASETKLVAIYKRQLKALEAQKAELLRLHASKEAILGVWESIDAVEQKIRGAADKTTNAAAANEKQFLGSFADIVSKFAPNALPAGTGKGDTRLYELVHESRQTNAHLREIKTATRFPGAAFSLGAAAAVAG